MVTRMTRKPGQTPKPTANAAQQLPTFLEHVYELRRRLFWIVAIILVASSAAYPFLDAILTVLTAPLGGQQLYYLTPVGGFSFSIKICLYVGVLAGVPFVMYHLYRYLEPLMGERLRRSALFYVGMSSVLAITGVLFAYFISLPGALHFLTGMDLKNIQAMLTVDSYLTFVMTYLLGAALLFQIPLLLLIINTMTPLKPSTLLKSQRFVVVGAFVIAAIISPTPDILNQLLFAIPIIAMYELGVVLVWFQNRARARRLRFAQPVPAPLPAIATPQPMVAPLPLPVSAPIAKPAVRQPQPRPVMVDGFIVRPGALAAKAPAPTPRAVRPIIAPAARRNIQVPRRSVDGFIAYHRPQPAQLS